MDSTPKIKKAMTKDEVMLFIELINKFPIITSKETNASNNKLKEEAWTELTGSFNSKCGRVPRTKDQLKLKWDNLKKAARKRAQNIKMNMMKTGGGKADYIPPDEILDKVTNMMGSTCMGFAVPFGGDGIGADEFHADSIVIPLDEVHEEIHGTCADAVESSMASAQMPENDFLPEQREVKKRKINFSTPDGDAGEHSRAQFLYGMPSMSKSLKTNGKRKSYDDSRIEKNLAIANYFKTMREKGELEILILKKQLENMDKVNV